MMVVTSTLVMGILGPLVRLVWMAKSLAISLISSIGMGWFKVFLSGMPKGEAGHALS